LFSENYLQLYPHMCVALLQGRNFVDSETGKGTSTMEGGGQTIGEACRQGGEHTA
jgi:hypothetical protein